MENDEKEPLQYRKMNYSKRNSVTFELPADVTDVKARRNATRRERKENKSMKTMIKIASLSLVLVVMMSLFSPVFAEDDNHAVSFSFSLRQNFFFALYDVNIYVDDEYMMTLCQGDNTHLDLDVTSGEHIIKFMGTGSYAGLVKEIILTNAVSFSFVNVSLQAHEKYIEINDLYIR